MNYKDKLFKAVLMLQTCLNITAKFIILINYKHKANMICNNWSMYCTLINILTLVSYCYAVVTKANKSQTTDFPSKIKQKNPHSEIILL